MKVFISHAQEDTQFAQRLAAHLSKAGCRTWLTAQEILPGENVASKVGEALDESDAMVILMSPAAAKSRSVREEILYAIGAERYAGRVIPVVIKPTDDMPWVLRKLDQLRSDDGPEELSQRILDRLQHVTQ